jgi:hypothetical protein
MKVEEDCGRDICLLPVWVEGSCFTFIDFTILCGLVQAKQADPARQALGDLDNICLIHSKDLKESSPFTVEPLCWRGRAPKVSDSFSQATNISPHGLEYHGFDIRLLAELSRPESLSILPVSLVQRDRSEVCLVDASFITFPEPRQLARLGLSLIFDSIYHEVCALSSPIQTLQLRLLSLDQTGKPL